MIRRIISTLKYAFFSAYTVIILYPIFVVIISSFKSNEEIYTSPWGFPRSWMLESYTLIWTRFDMGYYFLNSIYYAVCGCMISLVLCSMGAFAISKLKWKLSKLTMAYFLLGMMVPVHATIIPLYINILKIGIRDPRISLLLVFVAYAVPFTVFVLASFMESIPRSLEEAAVIDGCNVFMLFLKIITPLTKPAIATVTVFNFLGIWNDLLMSLVFITEEKHKTLQLGLLRFQSQFTTRYSPMLAALTIAMIPVIVVYLFLQDKIVEGVSAGAIKG